MLGCGLSAFTYTAFEFDNATPSPETTPTSTTLVVGTIGSSSRPTSSAATSPSSSTSSTTTSSNKTTVEIVVIVVLGFVSVTSFAISLYFLTRCYQLHRRPKYTPIAQTSPNPNQNSTSQPEKGLSKWSKIAGIVSPCIALASLSLAFYVAFR